jgi:RNA-directed DNA polymerase
MQTAMSTNGLKRQLKDWSHIKWKKVNKLVKNLRQRIFRARKLGNFKTLRSLQKLMQKSYANLLLSVRRITQTNKATIQIGNRRIWKYCTENVISTNPFMVR